MASCFRIYYSLAPEPLVEQLEAAALAEAVRLAASRCARSPQLRYFEIWRDANLLFASGDHLNSGAAPVRPQLRLLAQVE